MTKNYKHKFPYGNWMRAADRLKTIDWIKNIVNKEVSVCIQVYLHELSSVIDTYRYVYKKKIALVKNADTATPQ